MANYNISLDLGKMNGVKIVSVGGEKALFIPLADNHLTKSENGRVYISCAMWERTNRETGEVTPDEHGSTHYLKLNYPKEVRDALPEGEKIPYIGNAYPVKPRGGSDAALPEESLPAGAVTAEDNDKDKDLPF